MNVWEFFLGLAVGNMLGTWAAQRQIRSLQKDFDRLLKIAERHERLNKELMERLTSRNRRACQPKEN